MPVTLLLITFLEFLFWIFVLWSHLGRFCVGSMSVHDVVCLFNSDRLVPGGFGRETVFTIVQVIIAWWALESRCSPNSILFPFKFFQVDGQVKIQSLSPEVKSTFRHITNHRHAMWLKDSSTIPFLAENYSELVKYPEKIYWKYFWSIPVPMTSSAKIFKFFILPPCD